MNGNTSSEAAFVHKMCSVVKRTKAKERERSLKLSRLAELRSKYVLITYYQCQIYLHYRENKWLTTCQRQCQSGPSSTRIVCLPCPSHRWRVVCLSIWMQVGHLLCFVEILLLNVQSVWKKNPGSCMLSGMFCFLLFSTGHGRFDFFHQFVLLRLRRSFRPQRSS